MNVTVIWRKQEYVLENIRTAGEALAALGLPAELYLVVRDGMLLNENDKLEDGDTLQLVGVISGG